METRNFYLKISGATVSTLTAATTLISNIPIKGLIAAGLTVTAAFLIRSAEKTSRKTGRTPRMKAALEAVRPGTELLLISAGLISYSTGTAVTSAVIGLVAFSQIYRRSMKDSEGFFGQEIRVGLLVLSFAGYGFNQYVLFYGLLAIGLTSAVDSIYMLYRSMDTGF